jgi:hypothetical protein
MHRLGQGAQACGAAERYRRAIEDAPAARINLDHAPALVGEIKVEPVVAGPNANIDITLNAIECNPRSTSRSAPIHRSPNLNDGRRAIGEAVIILTSSLRLSERDRLQCLTF